MDLMTSLSSSSKKEELVVTITASLRPFSGADAIISRTTRAISCYCRGFVPLRDRSALTNTSKSSIIIADSLPFAASSNAFLMA